MWDFGFLAHTHSGTLVMCQVCPRYRKSGMNRIGKYSDSRALTRPMSEPAVVM